MKTISLTRELLKESGIPERFWAFGRNDYFGEANAIKQTEKFVTEAKEAIKGGVGLLFVGMRDSGKSFLMTYALKCLLSKGYNCQYASLEDLKEAHFDEDPQSFFRAFLEPTFLGIDNCDTDYNKGHALAIGRVLRARYDSNLPTLVCTKLQPADFSIAFGESASKFVDQSSVLVFCGFDHLPDVVNSKAKLTMEKEVQPSEFSPKLPNRPSVKEIIKC